MAISWFICPYQRVPSEAMPTRACAMQNFHAQIVADGGRWCEVEILGDRALVKVLATEETLAAIAASPGFRRLPETRLSALLGTLTTVQRAALRDEILSAGYSLPELNAALPDLSQARFGEVLNFLAQRRRKPRYDAGTDTIICDGAVVAQQMRVEYADAQVTDQLLSSAPGTGTLGTEPAGTGTLGTAPTGTGTLGTAPTDTGPIGTAPTGTTPPA